MKQRKPKCSRCLAKIETFPFIRVPRQKSLMRIFTEKESWWCEEKTLLLCSDCVDDFIDDFEKFIGKKRLENFKKIINTTTAMTETQRLAAYEGCGGLSEEIKDVRKSGGQYLSSLELSEIACALMKLKKYREAETRGLLVTLPCKVGDKYYSVDKGHIREWMVYSVSYQGDCVELGCETRNNGCTAAFRKGREVKYFSCGDEFLYETREEAESVLKDQGGAINYAIM